MMYPQLQPDNEVNQQYSTTAPDLTNNDQNGFGATFGGTGFTPGPTGFTPGPSGATPGPSSMWNDMYMSENNGWTGQQ